MSDLSKLKQMVNEPASKEWFAKHGTPKHKALNKKVGEQIENSVKNKINRKTTPLAKNEHAQKRYGEAQEHQDRYREAMKKRWG